VAVYRMTRVVLTIGAISLCAVALPWGGRAAGPFETRLDPDRQILQVLNRLTFGPAFGDVDEVRRIGVNKWIDQQLHPEQITENPVIEEKLKHLESLHLTLAEVVSKYTPADQMMAPLQGPFNAVFNLPQEQRGKILNGTAEERTAVLKAMEPEQRTKILASLPPNVANYTPEYKEEAEQARKQAQEDLQKQNRLRNPAPRDLLDEEQLKITRSGDPEKIRALFESIDPEKRARLAAVLPPAAQAAVPEYRREGRFQRSPRLVASDDLKEARIMRAVYSKHQLEEVLVDFWMNHFNIDATKNVADTPNLGHILIGSFERDAIRPHVLGHFKDLLLATSRHPAMLFYLDNWESVAPSSFQSGPYAPRRNGQNQFPAFLRFPKGLNENYGREIMELHTLGVKGGYTQEDVIAVARCFTGWTVWSADNPEYTFAPFMHDFGEKTVLGHKIPAGGAEDDGLKVIDILAHHPSTAKFISYELARHFVADNPPDALVTRMAQTFQRTDGDLRAVMETMLHSSEFLSEGAWQARVKSPLEMIASTIRAMGGDVTDAFPLIQRLADMGQDLYGKTEPNGYPDVAETWLSTAGIMARVNFASSLATGDVPGVKIDASRWNGMDGPAIARAVLGRPASAQTMQAIQDGLSGKDPAPLTIASLVVGSPDFERR
jgi:uncharacterized protein (DUF1800 family)